MHCKCEYISSADHWLNLYSNFRITIVCYVILYYYNIYFSRQDTCSYKLVCFDMVQTSFEFVNDDNVPVKMGIYLIPSIMYSLHLSGSKCICTYTEDELSSNRELVTLAENFRDQAAKLVDMLDVSIPVVSKLKVCLICIDIIY